MGALLGLAGLLLKFSGNTIQLFKGGQQVEVQFRCDRADGLAEGAQVSYRGVTVGRITSIRRDSDSLNIIIDALIDNTPPLPGNVTGTVRTVSLVSGIAAMQLDLIGGLKAVPQGTLTQNQKIPAVFVGTDLIPDEYADELKSAGQVIKGINNYVNDPKIGADLRASLENIRHITERVQSFSDKLASVTDQATSTIADAQSTIKSTQVDEQKLSRQIDDRMLQVSKMLESFQGIVTKVNGGQGTAGLLVNDPKLYQSLLENSHELNTAIASLNRLVEQWEQEGATLKLK
jgi:phospholipid/cholesterol/gamma-HCH transport system substrate-binding protein